MAYDEVWDMMNGVPNAVNSVEMAQKYLKTMRNEFKKISKIESVSKSILGVALARIVIDEECTDDSKPAYRIYVNGTEQADLAHDVETAFQKFVDEGNYFFYYHAHQLKTEIPRAIDDYLNRNNHQYLFWCMKTRNDGVTLLDAKTIYDLIIVKFNKDGVEKNISFNNKIHPFFGGIKREWVYGDVNDLERRLVCYNELFRRAASFSEYFLYLYSDVINALSSMKYENAENKGTIISLEYHKDESFDSVKENYEIMIEFEEPIQIEEAQYKKIRKLLEISNEKYALLMNDRNEIFAIGSISLQNECKYYKVVFDGYLHWHLYIGDEKYIEYVNMIPRLPDTNTGISDEDIKKYKDTFKTNEITEFKHIINEATEQGHGTMVVFAENAKEEAERLCVSGMRIKPKYLDADGIVHATTSIDGAIMCDERGLCFAIGMILDGKTSKAADSSRGARYNSAIRYLEQQKEKNKKTVIVVVSEDGYVRCFSTNELE